MLKSLKDHTNTVTHTKRDETWILFIQKMETWDERGKKRKKFAAEKSFLTDSVFNTNWLKKRVEYKKLIDDWLVTDGSSFTDLQ